jgi:glucose-1-phosphate cytidylyltransferase
MLTYGDGVSDVNIKELLKFHQTHGKYCTVTSVQPSGRFGALDLSEDQTVMTFMEKPKGDGAWINGGFFVCQPEVFNYIDGDATIFEKSPMEKLAADRQMKAFNHSGFWKPMDTIRDKHELEEDWSNNLAKWKIW